MSGSRIPADQTASYSAWNAPEVQRGQIIAAEKLQNKGPRGELIDVDKKAVVYNSITAGQLEDIANQAYEDVRKQAFQEGLKQGRTKGYQAGLKAGQQHVDQQAQQLKHTIAELTGYIAGQDDDVEQALINVATLIAKAVLRRELTIDSSHIEQLVKDAVASLPMNASNIQIFLHPQDLELLQTLSTLPSDWQLQADPQLTAGGCRVKTLHSVVDYTLEEQFQQTVNALVEQRFGELAAAARARGDEPSSSALPSQTGN